MKLPHVVLLGLRRVGVRWGDSQDADWQRARQGRKGIVGRIYYETPNGPIILHPKLRRKGQHREAVATFFHEALHDFVDVQKAVDLSHAQIGRLEYALADFALANHMEIRCACAPCRKKSEIST